jgi:hypothetical protein
MPVAALQFKKFEKGALCGFLAIRYHGLTIRDCRLMENKGGGFWVALPQKEVTIDGERKWVDLLQLGRDEQDFLNRQVVGQLRQRGTTMSISDSFAVAVPHPVRQWGPLACPSRWAPPLYQWGRRIPACCRHRRRRCGAGNGGNASGATVPGAPAQWLKRMVQELEQRKRLTSTMRQPGETDGKAQTHE